MVSRNYVDFSTHLGATTLRVTYQSRLAHLLNASVASLDATLVVPIHLPTSTRFLSLSRFISHFNAPPQRTHFALPLTGHCVFHPRG